MGSARPSVTASRILWFMVGIMILIGVAIVVRRMRVLFSAAPPRPSFPEAAALDNGFAQHRTLTLVHIIPGLLFVLLAPLQFVRSLRSRRPELHRWVGRVVMCCALVIGVSALIMSPQMAIGGVNETVATMLFAILFLFSTFRAFVLIRRGRVAVHREWAIRAFAIGMAVTTVRPIMGVFFATRPLTHLAPHEFFGTAFWLGFTLSLIGAEGWINYTRSAAAIAQSRIRLTPAADANTAGDAFRESRRDYEK